ncbi:MAG: YraN family protein [Microbacterium sp.]|nr:MAG: YraN family protein [Microbacterium sp.]
MAEKDERGRAGEERASTYLRDAGYDILDRNWRCGQGEIDIVAATDRHVVVVEVKTRRTDLYGHPFEAIDARKRARLWRLARAWAGAHPEHVRGRDLRLDAVGVTGPDPESAVIEHLEDLR